MEIGPPVPMYRLHDTTGDDLGRSCAL